jgi:c-di-GMP-binding flagellar brake protein YcgR
METNFSGAERRKFKRTPVDFTVFYNVNSPIEVRIKVGDREIVALAADISEGGMAITTDCEILALAVITVKFVMLNDKAPLAESRRRSISVRAEVRYNMMIEGKREYRMGVRFVDLSDDDRRFIHKFVLANK